MFTKAAKGWVQTAELERPDTIAGDGFGHSVAVSGETMVVGAPGNEANAGAAYVFTDGGMGWQETELRGPDTVAKDHFGDSIAIFGNTVVISAPGHASDAGRVYVFSKTPTGWHPTAELRGSEIVGPKDGLGDDFGSSVAVWGSSIVVGAGLADEDAGRAYVFAKTAAGWHRVAYLVGSDTAQL